MNEKFAACVNIFPITSIYKWDGLREDNEMAMIIKTTYKQPENIEIMVKEMHYCTIVPCIILFSIDGGSRDYFDWINDGVLPENNKKG